MKKQKLGPIEKMLASCVDFERGKKTLNQVYYQFRGNTKMQQIQRVADKQLGEMLFIVAMDFMSWHGDRDDIIKRSVLNVAEHVSNPDHN
jgi:hypothetical protein